MNPRSSHTPARADIYPCAGRQSRKKYRKQNGLRGNPVEEGLALSLDTVLLIMQLKKFCWR